MFHHVKQCGTNEMSNKQQNELYLGIELEIDSHDYVDDTNGVARKISKDGKTFYCKRDASLDYGFEIVSHPISWEYFKKNKEVFKDVLATSRKNGFLSHDVGTCGMHVHVNKNFLTELDTFKVIYFIFSNPDFVKSVSNRNWNQINRWASVNIDDFVSGSSNPRNKIKNLTQVAKRKSGGSRVAINLQNRHTIEFRIFRGTLNWNTYQKNLEFVHSVIMWAKKTSLKHIKDNDAVFSYLDFLTQNQNEYRNLILFLFNRFFSFDLSTKKPPPLYNQMKKFDFYGRLNLNQLLKKRSELVNHVHSNS